MSENKIVVSVKETAQILGVSVPIAYELVHRADFPSVRIGKRILVSVDGLKDWINRNCGMVV